MNPLLNHINMPDPMQTMLVSQAKQLVRDLSDYGCNGCPYYEACTNINVATNKYLCDILDEDYIVEEEE